MSMANLETGIGFHSVSFGGADLEVSYYDLDGNDDPTSVRQVSTLIIPFEVIEGSMGELVEVMEQIVNEALVAKRKAPDKFVGRR